MSGGGAARRRRYVPSAGELPPCLLRTPSHPVPIHPRGVPRLPFLNSSRRTSLRPPLIYPGKGKGPGGHLRTYGAITTDGYVPNQALVNVADPDNHAPAIQIWQTDLLLMSGCTAARLHPGSEGGEFDLALALSGSCWPTRLTSRRLKIQYVGYVAQVRYPRSIPSFNQNSKSVDFGLSSPGSVTHSPMPSHPSGSDGTASVVQPFHPSASRPALLARPVLRLVP